MKNVDEYILCAAIWYKEFDKPAHSVYNTETGVVLCGWRHAQIIGQFNLLTGKRSVTPECGEYVQGFLTSKNRFVDRVEGKEIFEKTNEKSEFNQLYSEDLY